jgi:hypothetical protein
MDSLGYSKEDFIPCELSGNRGVDIHHIIGRGKGGEDRIENLMCLTRELHHDLGDKKEHMIELLTKHRNFLAVNGVKFSLDWFDEKINYYQSITA